MAPSPRIAIIGAGFGGLGMAIRLKGAGIESFTIYEKAGDVGGTWLANTYPGLSCDVPSYLYSFSFAPSTDWTRRYRRLTRRPNPTDYQVKARAGTREGA